MAVDQIARGLAASTKSGLSNPSPGNGDTVARKRDKLLAINALFQKRPQLVDGRAIPVMDPAAAPTLTWYISPGSLSAIGLPYQWSYTDGHCLMSGGIPTAQAQGWLPLSRFFNPAGGASPSPTYWSLEADVTDAICGVYVYGPVGNGLRIIVDGKLVNVNSTSPGSGPSFNALKLDFTSVGGRAQRRIKVQFNGGGGNAVAFLTSATGVAVAPTISPIKLMIMGDSTADGTAADWRGDGYARLMPDNLSVEDCRISSSGGTGFITVGAGVQNFVTRITDVTTNNPDILFTPLSSNDYSQTPAAVSAAVLNYVNTIRASLPNLPIVLAGSPWNDASLANAQAIENAVATAVAGAGLSYVSFVRTKTIPAANGVSGGIITSGGSVSSPNGLGTSDYGFETTLYHPNTVGHKDIATFYAEAVRGSVANWVNAFA